MHHINLDFIKGVRGTPRPAAFGGPLCGLPNAMLAGIIIVVEPTSNTNACSHRHKNLKAFSPNAPRSPVCRSVWIPDNLSHSNSDGTNRSQNTQRQCGRFDKVTVTRSRSTVTLLRVTVTRFTAATALKQRRFDILIILGAGRIQDLHPQNSTVTTVTRTRILPILSATA